MGGIARVQHTRVWSCLMTVGTIPECMKACRKVASPRRRLSRFCSTSTSCSVPLSRKWRKNCDAVVLLKKDRSKEPASLNSACSSSSFLQAIVAATAAHISTVQTPGCGLWTCKNVCSPELAAAKLYFRKAYQSSRRCCLR